VRRPPGRAAFGRERIDQAGAARDAELKRELQALRTQNRLYATAIEQMTHGLSMFDEDDRLVVANRRYCELWRLPEEMGRPGTHFRDILTAHGAVEIPRAGPEYAAPTDPRAAGRRRREWRTADGRVIEVAVTRLNGGACVALHEDITERRGAEDRIAHQARHDLLTGLPNPTQLREALQLSLPRTQRGEDVALLCLDLDHFKLVNDTLGHPAGDQLLRQVAQRLRHCVRGSDVAARMGGDEFAVLQVGAAQPASSTALARRMIEALGGAFDIDGHQAHIGASVGIAIAPFDGESPETLFKNADLALYRAKADGRNLVRYFEPEMDARMQERRTLENDLRSALPRGEFELAFQPQVAVDSGAVVGVEALLRWNHPTRGRVNPQDFIPLAEETGLIVEIGQWVLQRACLAARHWPGHVRVSVNVSTVQFKSRSLVFDVMQALADASLPPRRLELEITESVLLRDTEQSLAVLHEFRKRGIRIALDDFGTGYSSLSYLRKFPFDRIKIDRSFVQGVENGGDALAVIQAIATLSRSLGMATTVEGVETLRQLGAVREAGCVEVQGFLYSGPRTAAEIPLLLREGLQPAAPLWPDTVVTGLDH
jgi:diguanylate cyclase (GGDEF)-like protein